jgi:hypothetical protein
MPSQGEPGRGAPTPTAWLARSRSYKGVGTAIRGRPEHFAISYLLYERCARVTAHFRRSAGRGAAWLARLTGGQEVGGSNPPGPTKALVKGPFSWLLTS